MRLSELANADDWLGVVALEREALELVRAMGVASPKNASSIYLWLGNGFMHVGEYARARELHEQHKAMAEELGDRRGVARACSGLGNLYYRTGEYALSRDMHEQCKAICEALGDRAGVATAWTNLANCYFAMGEHVRAEEMYEQGKARAEELGDREGVAAAWANLGNCYIGRGDFARAREMYELAKAICEAMGDRARAAIMCSHLGECYFATGDYGRARELYEQTRAMAEALGDRAGVATACANLGNCYIRTSEYGIALTFYKSQHAIATELKIGHVQADAALRIGVALRLHIRADRQAAGASSALELGAAVEIHSLQKSPELNGVRGEVVKSQDLGTERFGVKTAPGRELALKPGNLRLIGALTGPAARASGVPDPLSSASARLENRVGEAAMWLQTALAIGAEVASLHLAHLAYDAGQEDAAVTHLQNHLAWCVSRGRNWCDGCQQKRGEDSPMLTCSGCRVARFCSADHQKMASKSNFRHKDICGRHKDICGVLGCWHGVKKDGALPDSLRADLLAFLRQRQ